MSKGAGRARCGLRMRHAMAVSLVVDARLGSMSEQRCWQAVRWREGMERMKSDERKSDEMKSDGV